jgi:hypothetical protein
MIAVYKTNIECTERAAELIIHIHSRFSAYQANFDLADCDHILRVITNGAIDPGFTSWLFNHGCEATALPD